MGLDVCRLKGLILHFEFSSVKNNDTNEKNEAITNACQRTGLENNCLPTSRVGRQWPSKSFDNDFFSTFLLFFWIRIYLVNMCTTWSKRNIVNHATFSSSFHHCWENLSCVPELYDDIGTKFPPQFHGLISNFHMAFKLTPPWFLERQTSEGCLSTYWLLFCGFL